MNGLGLRPGTTGAGEKAQGNNRRIKDWGEETGFVELCTVVRGGVIGNGVGVLAGAAPSGEPCAVNEGTPAPEVTASVAGD